MSELDQGVIGVVQRCERHAPYWCVATFSTFVEKAYFLAACVIGAREFVSRETNSSIAESIRNSITTDVLELNRAYDLPSGEAVHRHTGNAIHSKK